MFGHDNNNHQDDQAQNQPANDDGFGAAAPTPNDPAGGFVTAGAPQTFAPVHHGTPPDLVPANNPAQPPSQHVDAPAGDLMDIKQQALQQLSPLVSHLDQTPEEKLRTTMMMIQASDDQSLIPAAFESAKQITDDKARAQALLDIINEINYFTQQHKS